MADVLTNTITVRIDGDEFEFAVPTPLQSIQVGAAAAAIRRRFDPTGIGAEEGLDTATFLLVRSMAAMQVLLKRSTAVWPWDQATGKVNIDNFPPEVTPKLIEIYEGFLTNLSTFQQGRLGNGQPPSAETVAGQQNPTT